MVSEFIFCISLQKLKFMPLSVEFINLNSSLNKQCGEEWVSLLAQRPSKQKDNLEEKSENFLMLFLALCSTTHKDGKISLFKQSVKFYIWTIWVKFIN